MNTDVCRGIAVDAGGEFYGATVSPGSETSVLLEVPVPFLTYRATAAAVDADTAPAKPPIAVRCNVDAYENFRVVDSQIGKANEHFILAQKPFVIIRRLAMAGMDKVESKKRKRVYMACESK